MHALHKNTYPAWTLQILHRFRFNLANALSGDFIAFANFFQRQCVCNTNTVAQPNNLLLLDFQRGQHLVYDDTQLRVEHDVHRIWRNEVRPNFNGNQFVNR